MFNIDYGKKPNEYSPLVLAYIGDAVYEIYVRSRVIAENPDMPAYKLHKETVKFVKAHAQSVSIHNMSDILTEKETAVFKRGRNAKSPTAPKNADLTEYRHATGFECLMGYLYLDRQYERMEELMKTAFDTILNQC